MELILPSLFPFFVVSGLLSRLGFPAWLGQRLAPAARRLFGVSGEGATALVVGLCGGYPLGAAYLAQLLRAGRIGAEECARLLAFCNNSGPAFFLGAIGAGVFHSPGLGLLLYASHALSAILTGLLLRRKGNAGPDIPPEPERALPFARALSEAVGQAIPALLNVCGFVVCFTVFTALLNVNGFLDAFAALAGRFGCPAKTARAALTGFFELGGGIGALRGLPRTPLNAAFAAALVGWGGLSVHFQTLALFADRDVKSAPHTAGRLLSALISFCLVCGALSLISI